MIRGIIFGLGAKDGVGFFQFGDLVFESVSATGNLGFDGAEQSGDFAREQ